MAETSGHGAIHRKSSGNRPTRTGTDQPSPPPPVQRSRSPPDLISALPDAVIHHIFLFLPLEDVVKTSVLSKRWRSTWTFTTDLVFDRETEYRPETEDRHGSTLDFLSLYDSVTSDADFFFYGETEDRSGSTSYFSSLIDSVLNQCRSPTLKRFHVIGFKHRCADSPKVDLWLRFAVQRRAEDIRLSLHEETPSPYLLPGFLYCLNWLVRLKVSQCRFSLDLTIRWPCLKFLSIGYVELSDDFLGRIFRGCPVLESLELDVIWGVKNIMIDSTSVKEFILLHPEFSKIKKIRVPHLLSLRVSGWWRYRNLFSLNDISSLVEAELDFEIPNDDVPTGDKRRRWCESLKRNFEKLHQVPTISIGVWCLELLSLFEMEGVRPRMSKCQNLTLQGPVGQWDLPGIAYMLRSSHCLEKLVIHLTYPSVLTFVLGEEHFNFDEEVFLCSRKGDFQCLAKHLKRVKIIGSEADSFGSKHLLALVKFLLGNALVLEKLIISFELPARHAQKCVEADVLWKLLGVSKNVLRYRRASKNAEVIFDYPSVLVSS